MSSDLHRRRRGTSATSAWSSARGWLLIAADLAAVTGAAALCGALLGGWGLALAMAVVAPLVVLTSKLAGLYERDVRLIRKSTLEEAPALFWLAMLGALAIWLLDGVLIGGELPIGHVPFLWLALFAALLGTRGVARAATRRLLSPERCLLVGDGASVERIRDRLLLSTTIDAEVVAEMPIVPRPSGHGPGPRGWTLQDLSDVTRRFGVERILVAPDNAEDEQVIDLVHLARTLHVRVAILPRILELVGTRIEPDDLDGIPVLAVRELALARSAKALKRGFDLVVSALVLAVLAPIGVLLALAIRAESPGPVLFRQTRTGRGGKPFGMLKFRTMTAGAEVEREALRALNEAMPGLFKIADDPRVTRIGGFLRRTALDELPQLVNVLRGEMSLVGPRPLVPEEDQEIQGWDRRRLELIPGITGPWQLLGPYRVSLDEMAKIDCVYGASWSLWTDVKLLLRTVPHVLGARGS